MSDKSMRGTRLGGQSLETDAGVKPAARQEVSYVCASGHSTVVPMSIEAEIPTIWECRCGRRAALLDAALVPNEIDAEPAGPVGRTHWDMLLERRTVAELEVLLQERLGKLRRHSTTS